MEGPEGEDEAPALALEARPGERMGARDVEGASAGARASGRAGGRVRRRAGARARARSPAGVQSGGRACRISGGRKCACMFVRAGVCMWACLSLVARHLARDRQRKGRASLVPLVPRWWDLLTARDVFRQQDDVYAGEPDDLDALRRIDEQAG